MQLRIARDKERAKVRAKTRRLRREPIVVAYEVTGLKTGSRTEKSDSDQQVEANLAHFLINLVARKHKLLKEADKIQSGIQVIRRSFPHIDSSN